VELFTAGPARVVDLRGRGTLLHGSHADVTIFDPKKRWTYDAAKTRSKSHNSPLQRPAADRQSGGDHRGWQDCIPRLVASRTPAPLRGHGNLGAKRVQSVQPARGNQPIESGRAKRKQWRLLITLLMRLYLHAFSPSLPEGRESGGTAPESILRQTLSPEGQGRFR
jgi:hypothetical protein